MFKQIKKLLKELSEQPREKNTIDFNTALAALLIEVMRADGKVLEIELIKITEVLVERCELDDKQVNALITLAQQLVEQAIDLYAFVKQINNNTSDIERIEIVQLLWFVAYADNDIDRYEDHIIRKIAGLLYVSHADFIAAKLAAQ
ncbi:TerB family tellurite resistance protein [Pseudoalteromonas sp. MMG012]|uniref:tellurite resistance TerB family protein n=1 Tax=Pseudoalteromonas sp. MMG012 TaxID=2822686 RepID=UPI001B3A5867|nr:TerB family tellurite resistance protein [Pseudoalteromonas sp. MMG012]MBQ4852943.1 TerB family tellurite resistance protein [Pseudoalteromonas sp. MMG012]